MISKWLTLSDDRIIDIVVAAIIANRIEGDPLWLLIVAPPSSAKTEILRALAGLKDVYLLSNLTPQTFISGARSKNDPSLLPKLNDKTLIMKDFGTVLTLRPESRAEIFAQLREIFDGQYSKAFGTGETVSWTGKMGFVAGCTHIIDRHSQVYSALGERFVQYRIEAEDPLAIAKHARTLANQEEQMRAQIAKAVEEFFENLGDFKSVHQQCSDKIGQKLDYLTTLLGICRTSVPRDRYSKEIEVSPLPEGPGRLSKQLMKLGIALAVIQQKEAIDEEIYSILKKVATDTMTALRLRVLRKTWDQHYTWENMDWVTAKALGLETGIPKQTVSRLLEDLELLKVLSVSHHKSEPGSPSKGQKADHWQINKKACDMIELSEIFEDSRQTEGVPF